MPSVFEPRCNIFDTPTEANEPFATQQLVMANFRSGSIVLQKSKVAGSLIFRENIDREEIADSYRLNRVAEAAGEFGARR